MNSMESAPPDRGEDPKKEPLFTMSDATRRLAAIMFTDIVGYSALVQRDESHALEILEEHRRVLRPLISQHLGDEIKTTGDGFLLEFASALQAVLCAIEMQKAVREWNQQNPEEDRFQIRIGIHVGDIVHQENDVLGDGVNIASRIEPIAQPGGICISEQVYDHVRNRSELHIVGIGQRELKNIEGPLDIYRVLLPWDKITKQEIRAARTKAQKGVSGPFVVGLGAGLVLQFMILGLFQWKDWNGWMLFQRLMPKSAQSAAAANPHSIAVIPFDDYSPNSEGEYFSDGMTEELINALSKLEGVRVPARTSTFAYKGRKEDVRTLGRQLQVETVLEGSVRKNGNQVRITATLSNTRDGYQLWTETFDRELEDIFAVQEEITRRIVSSLKMKLQIKDNAPLVLRPTQSMEAYNCYLKGRGAWSKRTQEGFDQAISCFNNAIAHDPDYALAYAGLADTYHLLERYGYIDSNTGRGKVKEYAEKALSLDDSLAAAHTSLATIHEADWNWKEAERSFQRALELDPTYVQARHWYATFLSKLGRFDDSIRQIETALKQDPYNPSLYRAYGNILMAIGKYPEAIRQVERSKELEPAGESNWSVLSHAYALNAEFEKAEREIREATSPGISSEDINYAWATFWAIQRDKEKADEYLAKLAPMENQTDWSFQLALISFELGDQDTGFDYLDRALKAHEFALTHLRTSPALDSVRSDPRYLALEEQIGLRNPSL